MDLPLKKMMRVVLDTLKSALPSRYHERRKEEEFLKKGPRNAGEAQALWTLVVAAVLVTIALFQVRHPSPSTLSETPKDRVPALHPPSLAP
jgi:hypothetical protein